MRNATAVVIGLALGLGVAPRARADCVSDCADAYQQAMAACQQKYGAPDQEIALQDCLDDAQAQLGSCTDDCASVD